MEKKTKVKRKGQENLIPLNKRSPEERRRIARMGVEARERNKERKMELQNCMKQLLRMKASGEKKKAILREFGFTDEELTNQSLLMVALFQKGISGDVSAIKEITDMMEKLDMFENAGQITGNVTINLVTQGESYVPNAKDEQDIWDAENNTEWMDKEEKEMEAWDTDSEEDDWGDEVYDP